MDLPVLIQHNVLPFMPAMFWILVMSILCHSSSSGAVKDSNRSWLKTAGNLKERELHGASACDFSPPVVGTMI